MGKFIHSIAAIGVIALVAGCSPEGDMADSGSGEEGGTRSPIVTGPPPTAGNSPLVGETAPDFTLASSDGGSVQLSEAVEQGPVVLVFYRGNWCPFCQRQLKDFKDAESDFAAADAQVFAVSVEGADDLNKMRDRHDMTGPTFGFLSDPDLEVAQQYGGVTEDGTLHVPAVYVIGTDGNVVFGHSDVDYKVRAEFENVLSAVQSS